MLHILLATRNAGKLKELRELLCTREAQQITWRGLEEFPSVADAPETGQTLVQNARAKALYYAHATGLWTLADDSGLEVDALGGAPGVHSARYAGVPRDDAANNRKLVAALAGVPLERRTARFRCAMALAEPGRILLESSGTVEGLIIDEPRGSNGFGYDPHFLLPDLGKTVAELPAEQKNALSHRGRAARALLPQLMSLLHARREAARTDGGQ